MAINLQKDPTTLPENQQGMAKWTNMHDENLYTFYVKVEDLYYTVEFINNIRKKKLILFTLIPSYFLLIPRIRGISCNKL